MSAVYGYARVSTDEQDNASQIDALIAHGVRPERITEEKASGVKERPMLQHLLANLNRGDTLIVWKLDRLGRSTIDVLGIMHDLESRGVRLVVMALGLDTATPIGRMVITILAGIATFEREQALERINAGIAAAKARGQHCGRKSSLTTHQRKEAARLHAQEGKSYGEIAALFGVSRMSVFRAVTKETTV